MSDVDTKSVEETTAIVKKTGGSVAESAPPSPYRLYGSDNPGSMITSVTLTGDNYNQWANEMLNALQAKRKIGFINGTLLKPTMESSDYED